MNFPPDWDVERTSEEWEELARSLAGDLAHANHALLVDPNYIHFLVREHCKDGRLFHIGDYKGEYVKWLDRNAG
jgi:hypothetical protein